MWLSGVEVIFLLGVSLEEVIGLHVFQAIALGEDQVLIVDVKSYLFAHVVLERNPDTSKLLCERLDRIDKLELHIIRSFLSDFHQLILVQTLI